LTHQVGLDASGGKLISYLLILWLAACIGACLGLVVGTRTSDLHSAQQALTPILMPMMLFSGYMLPYPLIPRWLRWAYHISPYQHVFSALVANHLHNLRFHDCYFPAPTASGHRICFPDGDTYLTVGLALPASTPYRNVIAMLVMLLLLVLLGFQGLRRISL
jgi:ABC-type polysaccharide/polyol phosphate export permease